jgi:aldehyde:ferredoxin oxidoreductase
MVMTKSPLTGAITCSNSGGMFPTEFKRTGYDAIVFSGRSEKPVYLYLDREKAELRKADHLWGKDTHRTTDMLLAETDAKAKVGLLSPRFEKCNQAMYIELITEEAKKLSRDMGYQG